jgi:LacI family transcriptional regulator
MVTEDSAATARLAARELALTKPASYAFVGWCTRTKWSEGRARSFGAEIERRGAACAVFDEAWEIGETLDAQRRIAKFLAPLPRPVGIFAVNDYVAVQVVEACRRLGWECPEDYTLVGVDNEEMHCELSEPTISSIEQDFRGGGRLAADLLAELIANPRLPPRHATFAPTRLVRRQSSRALVRNDPLVARAVERIRRDAGTGISAADVLADLPVSRRLAERRFLAATGKTVNEEIQSVRLAHICEMLKAGVPIGHIAARCGMKSDSYLKRFFKARTGMTLRAWRKANAEPGGAFSPAPVLRA